MSDRYRCCSTGLDQSSLLANIPHFSLKLTANRLNPLEKTSDKHMNSNYILLAATTFSKFSPTSNDTNSMDDLLSGGINNTTLSGTTRNPLLYPSGCLIREEISQICYCFRTYFQLVLFVKKSSLAIMYSEK
ncbi:unnamed protein product [Heterobilharzia americana]|nr:unnamed protein product [Heterobilharzia americana]